MGKGKWAIVLAVVVVLAALGTPALAAPKAKVRTNAKPKARALPSVTQVLSAYGFRALQAEGDETQAVASSDPKSVPDALLPNGEISPAWDAWEGRLHARFGIADCSADDLVKRLGKETPYGDRIRVLLREFKASLRTYNGVYPVSFAAFHGGTVVLLTGTQGLPYSMKSHEDDRRSHAKDIAEKSLRDLKAFDKAFADTDIAYYGVTSIFTARMELPKYYEYYAMVAVIVPKKVAAAYSRAEISDVQLFSRSDVFFEDDGPFRKIELK